MKTLLKNGKIIIDGQREIHSGDILFDETGIINFGEHLEEKEDYEVIDVCGCIIQPGFIDIHMHGAIGKDFVIGKEAVNPVGISLLQDGTTGFLASLTVLSHEEELKVLKSLKDATSEGAEYLGVHMEGPYLSKEYKALMNETYLRNPVISELDEMLEANTNIKVMTIAPEREGMEEFIPYLIRKSIVPMIGHTASSAKEALRGLDLGAKGFTHLYNAMSQHTHRNPGCVTAALEHKNSYKELIMDGFHNDVEVVKASWRILGPEEIIMITDCMLGKGMPDGEYTFSELRCRKVGNTVRVHVRIKEGNKERIQVFEGIIIKVQGGGVNKSFTVRKISYGVGVEKTFLVHSPLVEKVELVRVGKARRARLFYLRDRVGKAAKTKEQVGARIENREITIKEDLVEEPAVETAPVAEEAKAEKPAEATVETKTEEPKAE